MGIVLHLAAAAKRVNALRKPTLFQPPNAEEILGR